MKAVALKPAGILVSVSRPDRFKAPSTRPSPRAFRWLRSIPTHQNPSACSLSVPIISALARKAAAAWRWRRLLTARDRVCDAAVTLGLLAVHRQLRFSTTQLQGQNYYLTHTVNDCYVIRVAYHQPLKEVDISFGLLAFPSQSASFGINNNGPIIAQGFGE